jgi:integrase
MKLRLDQKTVASLALDSGRNEDFAWDTELEGFGLRLRRGVGKLRRTFVAQYRKNGRTRRTTIGPVERLTAAQAREGARQILARVSLGGDPQAEKVARRIESARTFRSVVDSYLAVRKGEVRKGTHRQMTLYLIGPYFRQLHPMGVRDISRSDIAAQLTALSRHHGTHTVQRARSMLSTFFKWTMQEALADANPVIGTRDPHKYAPRERVLTDAELVAIWNACGEDEFRRVCSNDDFGRIVRLLILTGCRRKEIAGMRWSEFAGLDTGVWTLPKERSKNKRALTITLPPAALKIVRAASDARFEARHHHQIAFGRDHLFGLYSGDGFTNLGVNKQKLERYLGDAVKKPWHLHDIRRTVATRMADIGVQPHIIEAVLNHYSGHRRGVAGVYNRSPYEREVKTALLRWSEHVLALVEGREDSKVVAFPA